MSNNDPKSYQQQLEKAVQEYAASNKNATPANWDFTPLFTALCEGNLRRTGITKIEPPSGDENGGSPRARGDDRRKGPPKTLPKPPGTGSWKYSWYVPEWCHPEYDPKRLVSYTGRVSSSATDQVHSLHPALRPQDAVKNPTPWAMRFGIHPDEHGGRSRLSPTISATREPFEDLANQINLLPDEARAAAIQETWKEEVSAGRVPQPNHISSEVMGRILEREGLLSGPQLRQLLADSLGQRQDATNLEHFVATMRERKPELINVHSNFLNNALRDQDYQRTVFHDLTTDELLEGNIYTMANGMSGDLQGDIHPLFQRHRWSHTAHKGAMPWEPRLLYNLGGVRDEWNAATNDAVWNALQPALQLVTRVLKSNHPGVLALMEMRTREPLDKSLDRRSGPQTASIPIYTDIKEINNIRTFNNVANLHYWGFDWQKETWAALDKLFRLDFSSVFIDSEQSHSPEAVEGVEETDTIIYGTTNFIEAGTDSYIQTTLGAELVWPLLIPEYSESEKVTASFVIASTLLHEFGHAINSAHQALTRLPDIFVPHHPLFVRKELRLLDNELWDFDHLGGEPSFRRNAITEVGFELEKAIWGFAAMSLLTPDIFETGRLRATPFIAEGAPWPFKTVPGTQSRRTIKGAQLPIEEYITPIPIDHMYKFFTQKFWDVDFMSYGPESLKLSPSNRMLKTIMTPTWMDVKVYQLAYGGDEWDVVSFTQSILQSNGQVILAEYIRASARAPLMSQFYTARWHHEVRHWNNDTVAPLRGSIDELSEVMRNANRIHNIRCAPKATLEQAYTGYVYLHNANVAAGKGTGNPMTADQWKTTLEQNWARHYRDGGIFMRQLAQTYRYMMLDIAFLQRMVFDFFSLQPDARTNIYNGMGSSAKGPIGAAYARMIGFRQMAQEIALSLHRISQSSTMLSIKDRWISWAARYQSCYTMYGDLLAMLGSGEQFDPADISWKRRFQTVPSSYWKNRMDRLQTVALREYNRSDPRIREVVDECVRIIGTYDGSKGLPAMFPDQPNENDLAEQLAEARSLGAEHPLGASLELFDWKRPDGPSTIYDHTWQQASTQFQNKNPNPGQPAAPAAPPSAVFGEPNQLNPANLLEAGLPKRSPNAGPNPFSSTTAMGFVESMRNAGVPDSLQGNFGPGGPIVSNPNITSAFAAPAKGTPTPLHSPYAGPYTLSSDIEIYNTAILLAEIARKTSINEKTPYTTAGSWRDQAPGTVDESRNPTNPPILDPNYEPPTPPKLGNSPGSGNGAETGTLTNLGMSGFAPGPDGQPAPEPDPSLPIPSEFLAGLALPRRGYGGHGRYDDGPADLNDFDFNLPPMGG